MKLGKKELKMNNREHIPAELKRKILVEAGHRCAIPSCRFPTIEIAHIEPYEKVKEHKYENLIALCPNCHTRADKGEIDKKSLRIYKKILQRLTDKYDRFELNVLSELQNGRNVIMAGNMLLLIKNLLDESFVNVIGGGVIIEGIPSNVKVSLTQKGNQFIQEWISAKEELTY